MRIKFDPTNSKHLSTYQKFLKNGSWITPCPFELEWPHSDIPSMIQEKIIKKHLKFLIDRVNEVA